MRRDLLVDAVDVLFLVGFLAGGRGSGGGGILVRFRRHGRRRRREVVRVAVSETLVINFSGKRSCDCRRVARSSEAIQFECSPSIFRLRWSVRGFFSLDRLHSLSIVPSQICGGVNLAITQSMAHCIALHNEGCLAKLLIVT